MRIWKVLKLKSLINWPHWSIHHLCVPLWGHRVGWSLSHLLVASIRAVKLRPRLLLNEENPESCPNADRATSPQTPLSHPYKCCEVRKDILITEEPSPPLQHLSTHQREDTKFWHPGTSIPHDNPPTCPTPYVEIRPTWGPRTSGADWGGGPLPDILNVSGKVRQWNKI